MRKRIAAILGLFAIAALAMGQTFGPALVAATTCTNQFIRSIAIGGSGTCATVSLTADVTGVLPSANGGAGTINGVLKANGSGTTSLYAPARYTATPSNPTGTSNTGAFTMAGLAGSITPTTNGNVYIAINGVTTNSTLADGCQTIIRYGTGAAPTNGAAFTGTSAGSVQYIPIIPATATIPFINIGYVTGLSVGTAYWLDLGQIAVTGGTCSLLNITVVALEM